MNHSVIGKIKSLALRDFLTYDELKFFPGDNLNIIIGPNGTGKSTIVAGIILGCGGKPALLSRSKDISDYVKNGKKKAHIEIELCSNDAGEVITFHRTFDKQSKEGFSIDGETVNVKEYLRRIKEYNIQVDNLCMFLPQDRVQDFTKLNPQELLNNTQISVCSPAINNAFGKLLKIRDEQKNNTKNNCDLQTRLDDNRNRNEQLRVIIENNKTKDKLVAKADLLMKKKAWREHEEIGNNYKEVEADLKLMTEKVKKANDMLKPIKQKQESIAATKNQLKNAISKATSEMSGTTDQMDKFEDAANKCESDVNRARQNMKNVITSMHDHKKQVEELELVVQLEKNELQDAKDQLTASGDIEQQIRECDNEVGKIKSVTERLMQQRNAINSALDENIVPSIRNCERKINMLGDTQRQRLDVLRNKYEDAYKAYEWLNSNRQNFQGRIFNPVMTEITVKEKSNAMYVENTVGIKDMVAFVCTDKNDTKLLIKKLRNEMRLQVNVAYAEDTDTVNYAPPRDICQYPASLGLYSYLIDMIEGPAPIINYLCKLYRIHNIVVGDDQTFTNASKIPNEFRLFFSTNHRFSVNVSRYSNAKSTSSSMIYARNLLNVAVDHRLIEREQRNLINWKRDAQAQHTARDQLEDKMKENENQILEIRNTKKEFLKKINHVRMCGEKVRKKEVELQNLKNRNINVEAEREKFKILVHSLVVKLFEVNKKRVDALSDLREHDLKRDSARKKLQIFEESTGNLDDQIFAIQREIENTRTLYDRVKVTFDATKNRYNTKEKEALKLTDNFAPSHPNFKYKLQFEKLPNELEELQNQIEELQGRIECIPGVDPRILIEFEERGKAIEDLEHKLMNEKNHLQKLEEDLNNLHEQWYPAIQNVVQTINQNFSDFFNKMGFVGEVELTRKEERDYADYGIAIRVQYRDNEKLQALNRHVQSGGERAVAIAVYTLSLQHITSVPFRCVDEINQGMDPKNERKIFQMLVDITCKPDQSQYFFVTPKLLEDLPHSDLMCVSVVHNGKNIEDPYIFLNVEEESASDDVDMEDE